MDVRVRVVYSNAAAAEIAVLVVVSGAEGDVGTRSPSIFDHEHRCAWTGWLKVRFLAAGRSLVGWVNGGGLSR